MYKLFVLLFFALMVFGCVKKDNDFSINKIESDSYYNEFIKNRNLLSEVQLKDRILQIRRTLISRYKKIRRADLINDRLADVVEKYLEELSRRKSSLSGKLLVALYLNPECEWDGAAGWAISHYITVCGMPALVYLKEAQEKTKDQTENLIKLIEKKEVLKR